MTSALPSPRVLRPTPAPGFPGSTFGWLLFLAWLSCPLSSHAQGCAQCLDSTRATPPAVQAAYRHAILLLIGFASALFVAGLALLRRHR